MTEQATEDPTPSGSPDDESTVSDQIDPADVAEVVEKYRHELGAAQADAMADVEDDHGIETEAALYEKVGFTGEKTTIEIEAYDAELYVFLDLLDRRTDQPQPATSFVPQARLLDALMESIPTPLVAEWLARDLEMTQTDVDESAAPDVDDRDQEGDDE